MSWWRGWYSGGNGSNRGECNGGPGSCVIPVERKEGSRMEKDPVCGMQVKPSKAAGTSTANGKTYYFCSKTCKAKFNANPAQYMK
jgi:YHS domain-containing protein